MRPSLRLAAALAATFALAACGSDEPPGAPAPTAAAPTSAPPPTEAPTTGPSGSPTPVAAPGDDGSVLLLVTRAEGGLELHRVDRESRAATLVRRLAAPARPATVLDATLSGGDDPTVCASWHRGPGEVHDDLQSTLLCYSRSEQGREVQGVDRPAQVALSRDGDRLTWSLLAQGEQNPVFSTATFSGGQVGPVQRLRGDTSQPEDGFTGTDVTDLAWSDDEHVLVSTGVQSDDGPELLEVDVTSPPDGGWLRARAIAVPTDDADRGYTTYGQVESADADTALAVERGSWMDDRAPADRAVRIDLGDGSVEEVVATAAEGRHVVSVSGTDEAAVYVTAAAAEQRDLRVYLRTSGEERGTPVTGLPADTEDAQTAG